MNKEGIEEYDILGKWITKAMLGAERKLPKRRNRTWTKDLGELIQQARYYCLLLCQEKGLWYHHKTLEKVGVLAGMTTEIESNVGQHSQTGGKCKGNSGKFLKELIDSVPGNHTQEQAIWIKARESQWKVRRIRTTIIRLKTGGLS